MTHQQIAFVRACTSKGYGSEDISNMSMLTVDQVRDEVAELRRVGALADMFGVPSDEAKAATT